MEITTPILLFLGFGGAGAIVEGPLIGVIVDYYGWSGAFYFMVILSIIASLSLLRASRVDDISS